MGHPPPTERRHSIVKDRLRRSAGRHHRRVVEGEGAVARPQSEELRAVEGHVGADIEIGGSAPATQMTLGAVHLQIAAGPAVEIGGRVVRIDRWRHALVERLGDQAELVEAAQLVCSRRVDAGLRHAGIDRAVELRWRESVQRAPAGRVAHQALGAAGDAIALPMVSCRIVRVGNLQPDRRPFRADELGIGLLVVPQIAVGAPVGAVEMEKLGLDPPGGAGGGLEGNRLGEDAIGGKLELPADETLLGILRFIERELRLPRQGEPALGTRAVGPRLGADGIGNNPRRRRLRGGVGKQPGFAQAGGEAEVGLDWRAADEPVERARVVVDQEHLTVGTEAEGREGQRRVGKLFLPGDPRAIVPQPPHLPGDIVAVHIGPGQLGEPGGGRHIASGDRTALGVGMGDHRRRDRIGAPAPIPHHRLRPLHDAPAIIFPALDEVNHLPQFPSHVGDPQSPRSVERHPPRIPQTIGPHLPPRPRHVDERIVGRDRVGAGRSACGSRPGEMVDVDAQDRCEEILDRLPRTERIRRRGVAGVAGGDVEHPVGAELEAAAVVPPRHPVDDPLLTGRIDRRRIGGRDGEPRHARAVGDFRLEGVDQEALPVFSEARVEGEAEEVIEPLDRPQITDEVGVGHLLVAVAPGSGPHRERIHFPLLFGDHHPIASGDRHELRRLVEAERGEDRLVAVWWRRDRGPADPRAGPLGARLGLRRDDRSRKERQQQQPTGHGREQGAHGIPAG